MKVLILTTALGQGHNSAAASIAKHLQQMGHEHTVVDMYEYISPRLKDIMSKGYLFTVDSAAKIRPLAKTVYQLNESREVDSEEFSLSTIFNRMEASGLRELLDQYNPDAVICTQVYAAQAISYLKCKGLTNALAIGIITDFTVQTYWQDTSCLDYIVTSTPMLAYQLGQRGIPARKHLPIGIPIDAKFQNEMPAHLARRQLGLRESLPTILVMGGSMGYGKLDVAIKDLDTLPFDFQALVVCGSNAKLYERLMSLRTARLFRIYGYTKEVDLLMSASDLIVTKPGGITTSEALAKGLPMAIFDPIPGMEERNAEFLTAAGAAVLTTPTFSLPEAAAMVLQYPQNQRRMSQAARELAHPKSTEELCTFVEQEVARRAKDSLNPQS